MMEVLGSGAYSVTVSEATGRIIWQSTDSQFGGVTWARERNEVTKASVDAVMAPAIVNIIEPLVHLLTVYRDGELVWHGLLTKVRSTGSSVQLEAADGAFMFARRRVASNRTWQQTDATQVMRTMVEDGLGYSDRTGLVESIETAASRLWATAAWTAAEGMVSDVVSELVEMGLVWTVSAGRLLIGPVLSGYTTAQIADGDFDGEMTIVKDGSEVVTDALVVGKGVWGQWTVGDTPVGLFQSIESADGLVRAAECEQRAEMVVKDAAVPPRRLELPSGTRLMTTAPVLLSELVPGVRVPVATRQTGVVMASVMQLTKVEVTADNGGEQIKVTLEETNVTDRVTGLPDPADIDMRSPYEKELSKNQHTGTGSGAPKDEEQDEVGIPPA